MEHLTEFIKNNSFVIIILKVLILFVITKLSIKFSLKIIDKTVNLKILEKENSNNKFETFGNVAKSIAKYSIYFISGIIALTIIFGPIPLTFASVGAAIVGFGSQNLVKDIVSGFFILFEGQYAIGDHVTILNNEGIIEGVELRVTKIRAFNGDLFILPNGSITQVTNHSTGPQRFEVLITVDHSVDSYIVESTLNKCCNTLNKSSENILEPATLIGISNFTNTGTTYRILGKTNPLCKVGIEANLRKIIKDNFKIYNIKLANIIRS